MLAVFNSFSLGLGDLLRGGDVGREFDEFIAIGDDGVSGLSGLESLLTGDAALIRALIPPTLSRSFRSPHDLLKVYVFD